MNICDVAHVEVFSSLLESHTNIDFQRNLLKKVIITRFPIIICIYYFVVFQKKDIYQEGCCYNGFSRSFLIYFIFHEKDSVQFYFQVTIRWKSANWSQLPSVLNILPMQTQKIEDKMFTIKMMNNVCNTFVPTSIFSNLVDHSLEQSFEDNHRILLKKAICKSYLTIRIHHITKQEYALRDKIRSFLTKTILFKGQ